MISGIFSGSLGKERDSPTVNLNQSWASFLDKDGERFQARRRGRLAGEEHRVSQLISGGASFFRGSKL